VKHGFMGCFFFIRVSLKIPMDPNNPWPSPTSFQKVRLDAIEYGYRIGFMMGKSP